MTKQDEISHLSQCANAMPDHSYLKGWIVNQLPFLESLLRCDALPEYKIEDAIAACSKESESSMKALQKRMEVYAYTVARDASKRADKVIEEAMTRARLINSQAEKNKAIAYDALNGAIKHIDNN